jgi:hypothetical protein
MTRRGIVHLIYWVTQPSTPAELSSILEALTDEELVRAATVVRGNAGRIAWVELAKRYDYFDFQMGVTHGVGGLKLTFAASAVPAHDAPQYC